MKDGCDAVARRATGMRPVPRWGLWCARGGLLALLCLCLCAALAGAVLPEAQDLDPQAPVLDRAAALSADEVAWLRRMLLTFEEVHSVRAGIVIVPSTQPEDIAAYANRLGDGWRIGSRPGLLMVVAVQDRQARIEVSRALEGGLPDLFVHKVLRESMSPAFAQGRYTEGLRAGLVRISIRLSGDPDHAASVTAQAPARREPSGLSTGVIVAQAMVLVFGAMIYGFMWIFEGLRRWASPLFGGLVGLLEFAIAGQWLSTGPAVAVGVLIGGTLTVLMWRHAVRQQAMVRKLAPQREAEARREARRGTRRQAAASAGGSAFSSPADERGDSGLSSSSRSGDSGSSASSSASDSASGDFAGGGASDTW
jgi:uncharacterized protein